MSIISDQGEEIVREPSNKEEPAAASLREPSNLKARSRNPLPKGPSVSLRTKASHFGRQIRSF